MGSPTPCRTELGRGITNPRTSCQTAASRHRSDVLAGTILPAYVELAILVAAPILASLTLIKPLLGWHGLERYRNQVLGGPSLIQSNNGNALKRKFATELASLGFRPLGVCEERLAPWSKTFQEELYLSPDKTSFANVYSLFGEDWNVVLSSLMTDGTLIQTSTDAGEDLETSDCTLRRIPDQPLASLCQVHSGLIQRRLQSGLNLTAHETIRQAAQVQWNAFHNATRNAQYRNAMKTLFVGKARVLLAVPGPMLILWLFVRSHQLVSEMFLLGSAGWMLALSAYFIGIDLTLRFAKTRPNEESGWGTGEQSSRRPASVAGSLLTHHWIWLGAVVAVGWHLGDAATMVRTVLVVVTVLVIVEFATGLHRLRKGTQDGSD